MAWIKLHEEILLDDWYISLSDPQKIAWLHFLLLAKRYGGKVKVCRTSSLSRAIFTSENATEEMLKSAKNSGKVTQSDDGYWTIKNWVKYKSDPTNSERQKRHRERKKDDCVTEVESYESISMPILSICSKEQTSTQKDTPQVSNNNSLKQNNTTTKMDEIRMKLKSKP